MNKIGFVYIMTNKNRTTLYIGVTNNLCRRIFEHKNHSIKKSFTDKYNLEYCIYYEEFSHFDQAILREKILKKWNRQKKENLINQYNPKWIEIATEQSVLKNKIPFNLQVDNIINELRQKDQVPLLGVHIKADYAEIPPFGRNDSSSDVL